MWFRSFLKKLRILLFNCYKISCSWGIWNMFWFCNCSTKPRVTASHPPNCWRLRRAHFFPRIFNISATILYWYNILIGGRLHAANCDLNVDIYDKKRWPISPPPIIWWSFDSNSTLKNGSLDILLSNFIRQLISLHSVKNVKKGEWKGRAPGRPPLLGMPVFKPYFTVKIDKNCFWIIFLNYLKIETCKKLHIL